jgi:hypothetical protein
MHARFPMPSVLSAAQSVIQSKVHPDPNGWYGTNTVTPEASPTLYLVTRR